MEKSKIELIRDFIEKCSLLDGGKIHVDYIKDEPLDYSVNETPSDPIITQFVDGGSRRQLTFDFCIQADFSILENINNSRFCDDFVDWIEEQDKKENYPKIVGTEKIECTGRGTILQTTETTAIYVIPMRVVYLKEA